MAGVFRKVQTFFCDSSSELPMTLDTEFEQIEQSIRQSFVRKVYGLLAAQILISLIFIFCFSIFDGTRFFVYNHPFLCTLTSLISIIILIILFFSTKTRRTKNRNFYLLFILTLAKAYNIGSIAAYFSLLEIFLSLLITAVLCAALTMYAVKTQRDFTRHTRLTLILFIVLILMLFFGPSSNGFVVFRVLFAILSLLVFSVWLVYHTQLVIGGTNRKFSFSPEEYVFSDVVLLLEITSILYAAFSFFGGIGSIFVILLGSWTMKERGQTEKPGETTEVGAQAQGV